MRAWLEVGKQLETQFGVGATNTIELAQTIFVLAFAIFNHMGCVCIKPSSGSYISINLAIPVNNLQQRIESPTSSILLFFVTHNTARPSCGTP
jgi:hypothetical protein